MNEQHRQRQLAHLRAAVAECDKQHSPDEIQAAEVHLFGAPIPPAQDAFSFDKRARCG